MYIQSFQNAAASKITVTATATNIFDLINTAGSTTLDNAGFSNRCNAIIIQPEDGDIRVLFNNQTPTAANGFKITSGSIATLANVPLKSLKLIRTSGDVVCSIQVGITDQGEATSITGSGGGTANITQVGGVSAPTAGADAVSNTRTDLPTSARISGFNGTTWDRLKAGITTITSTFTGILNTLPWGIYHATPSTRTDGQGGPIEIDSKGNAQVNLNKLIHGEDETYDIMKVQAQFTVTNITTQTTTTLKSGAGQFGGLMINTPVANAVITIYDNTAASGTKLATITLPAALLSSGPIAYGFGAAGKFATGLTVVTSGATMDITTYHN